MPVPKSSQKKQLQSFAFIPNLQLIFQSSHLLTLPLSVFLPALVTFQSTRHNQRYEFVHPHVNEVLCLPTRLFFGTMAMFQLMPADFQTTCAPEPPHLPPPPPQLMNKSPGCLNVPWRGGGNPSFSGRKIVVMESNWTALYSFADRPRCEKPKVIGWWNTHTQVQPLRVGNAYANPPHFNSHSLTLKFST